MSRSLKLAWLCGIAPLVTGIVIFLVWLLTGWEWLMRAGIITLYAGLAAFVIGVVALVWYCWLALRDANRSRLRIFLAASVCAGVLLGNFPVAGGIVLAVAFKLSTYTVVIVNDSPHPLVNARLIGGGVEMALGEIPPGSSVERSMRFQRDDQLTLFTTFNGEYRKVEVAGYVTNNSGGDVRVVFDEHGKVHVRQRQG